ncbi:glycosyltransferase family 2 protein [Mucilaginibacter antarcticus]|uniref:Glycosyltransferase family 2 protein n=1 Tax=Mucilaginibacter antarcticus TaxID=1855725 RepID=A0ABW5XM97_9SPHI
MQHLKISIITVTYNAQNTLSRCIQSVIAQNYANIEYIIVDGASTDGTLQIISQYQSQVEVFVSEPDTGIYDAMNKGIKMATGDVIGILNADDYFAANNVISSVAAAFKEQDTQVLYGNLNYINPNGFVLRKWRSGTYTHGMFNWGWMPPHPTFYCRRQLFETHGLYDTQYGTAADYELMLRFVHAHKATTQYLNKVMVNMAVGGVSNQNYRNRFKAWGNDFKAMGKNGVLFPRICIVCKPIRKLFQFI